MTEERAGQLTGGVFLVGLGLVFATGIGFWPNILLVIAATSATKGLTERRHGFGEEAKGALFMLALWAFFAFGFNWAIILIVMGLGMLLGKWNFDSDDDGNDDAYGSRLDRKRKMDEFDDDEKITYVVGDDGELVPEDEYVEKRKLR